MKVTDIRTPTIAGNSEWLLVRVSTGAGITGLGETYWGAGVNELIDAIRPMLFHQDCPESAGCTRR